MSTRVTYFERMDAWCEKNRKNPHVLRWLEKNPPPKSWKGTALEWAFVEMLETS